MKRKFLILSVFTIALALAVVYAVYAWTPVPVAQDPLVRMPGTQPGQVALEAPGRCMNCHAGYDPAVEPGFNWKGSMMAQAARDFLYWSCLTVAGQDSIWAVGTPNAVDICERCHFPKGWLEGRSDPPNASAMTGADYDGVQCDFCHTMYDPFFETTYAGTREGADWPGYWDEALNTGPGSGTLSQTEADATYAEDMAQAQAIVRFNGTNFFDALNLPPGGYTESGSGQYFISSGSQKRASFADAAARHQMFYSRYHKSKYFCDTCHDVSNPVLANFLNPGDPLHTEQNSAFSYFHVERTFSEFMLSSYGQQGGAPGMGPFDPAVYDTSDPNNKIRMCQDCHMRDVVGVACNKQGVPVRPTDSSEHPQSGQPVHDLTGGNIWVSYVLASAIPGHPDHDPFNDGQLNQGPAALTLDLTQGEGIDPVALLAGVERAKQQLLLAATIPNVAYDPGTGSLSFRVQNNSAHKLISGFPEGRRMFVNIKAYSGGSLIYEVNPYDPAAGTLKGLTYPYLGMGLPDPQPLGANEAYVDELVYEMHPESDLTGESESFHFALATGRHKDNRIPPKGFDINGAAARLSVPVYYVGGVDVGAAYFTQAEYDGGYDEVSLPIRAGADYVEVNLYYQTTSREYIEFLRDEIKGTGNLTLPDGAYIIQTDPFFAQLKAWGDTIWNLWTHNMNVPGAAPFLMATAAPPCGAPIPNLLSADPGNQQVTLTWSDEHTGDPTVFGYRVYYDQAGKAQLVADVGLSTSFIDTLLTNGLEYCYKVTSWYDVNGDGIFDSTSDCESGLSNIMCATPNSCGQLAAGAPAGVDQMLTGMWVTTGKGPNKTTTFEPMLTFNAGDAVVIQASVVDGTGLPVADATVEITISGPETVPLTTGPSDVDGIAETTWQTVKPNKRGVGGTTPGTYIATVTNVTTACYTWDNVPTEATFTIQ